MSTEAQRTAWRVAAGALLVVCGAAGCSDDGDGDDEPTPVGGIYGPARVDPDTGGADNTGSDD